MSFLNFMRGTSGWLQRVAAGSEPATKSLPPAKAWTPVEAGHARILDLRTTVERRRYGHPPGVPRVSLSHHVARPEGADTIYLCQHANRSKLTGRNGAAEVEGGWPAWVAAGLPVEHEEKANDEGDRSQ